MISNSVKELFAAAEKAAAQGPAPVFVDLQPEQMFCQGDIGIIRLAKKPKSWRRRARPENGQVAPGLDTGSRHWVTGKHTWYRFDGDPLSDIGLIAKESWTLTHPAHGHVTCPPGIYQFVQQQNEQRQRVLE